MKYCKDCGKEMNETPGTSFDEVTGNRKIRYTCPDDAKHGMGCAIFSLVVLVSIMIIASNL